MKYFNPFTLIFTTTLFISCRSSGKSDAEIKEMKEVKKVAELLPQSPLKVSAYLIYDDGTLSSFDVLNDKTIALWNVIIGAGDAEKPSEQVRVALTGDLDSITIKIKNGRNLVVNKRNELLKGNLIYDIKNTGCNLVYVDVLKNQMVLYRDTIPFHCGE
jgi:hypothetical protein